MLFNNLKKTKVEYGIYTDTSVPNSIYPNINKTETNYNLKCPAVNTVDNKFYEVNSFIETEITLKYNQEQNILEYQYDFNETKHPTFSEVHNLIKSNIVISNANNQHTIQILLPYIFITDTKELELTVLDPGLETKNLKFISGSFNIYGWARGINTAYCLVDKNKTAKIKLKINKPILKYYFSNPVSLKYVNFSDKQLHFINSIRNSTFYRKNAYKLYKDNIKRRPKKLLQK